ncbi:hypothetical protein HMPREF9970_0561 [Lachnoanaerobaculum saburreum F0468]|uniref:Uncharacterized protein n=1 Tax=Lachnoanaerobaculum saburreum F0468 TaxID=1095750 RepID=I0RA06_9FIRM|nr:hypothetical protein HMPREF9970_0561 [Lachnoanaerobaculum saburreum F0468]
MEAFKLIILGHKHLYLTKTYKKVRPYGIKLLFILGDIKGA